MGLSGLLCQKAGKTRWDPPRKKKTAINPEDPGIRPKNPGLYLQSYDLGMGCFDHQSYENREGIKTII